jgi:nucleotide-binding universal stress UspA family protein
MATFESGLPTRALIVPLDGSERSARGVKVAGRLSPRLDAVVHLVGVASTQDDAEVCHRQFDEAADVVPGASRELVMSDDGAVHADDVAKAVVDSAAQLSGVVCMSSHGRGRSAAVLGSVATEIASLSGRPLVIAGPAFQPETWADDTPVIACVDGTSASETVVPIALEWAEALGVSLSLVTVAEPIPAPLAGRQWQRMHGPDEDAYRYIARLVERHRTGHVPLDGTVVYDPVSVARGMADHLTEHPTSLITVATRARTGIPRLLLGSAAAGILHEAAVPVLAVQSPSGEAA